MNALAPKRLALHSSLRQTRARGSLDNVLIEAAMDLFAAYGYRGTSLAKIARAAGVTKEFGLKQRLRDGSTVNCDKRFAISG